MKIPFTELSTDGAVSSIRIVSVGVYIYSKALITLNRITSTLYALFTLYAFSNQFSGIKVTILNKWYYKKKRAGKAESEGRHVVIQRPLIEKKMFGASETVQW